jgi:uncharacterized protein YutE (UPF0331/DUF86 family)
MDDVRLNKAAIIQRCIARIREVYADEPRHLTDDLTRQDSILLNLQRATEAAIDLAMHGVRAARLGVPQDSREAFELLAKAGLLDAEHATRLQRMVGFRSIAVHEYQALNLAIVQAIIEEHLGDLERFSEAEARRGAAG